MATAGRSTVVGLFEDRRQAERAIDELERAGFRGEQIGFVRHDEEKFEGDTGVGEWDTPVEERTSTGALTGGLLGGLLGAAAGLLEQDVILMRGIGPAVAGGTLATALGGVGAAVGVAAEGLLGALTGMGVPEREARYYEREFQAGRTLVTVKADGRYDEARSILRGQGAYDVETPGSRDQRHR